MRSILFSTILLGLLVLFLGVFTSGLCRPGIESDLQAAARQKLDAAGYRDVQVTVDHLDARLTGNVASEDAKLRAAKLVGGVKGVRMLNANNLLEVGEGSDTRQPGKVVVESNAGLSVARKGNDQIILKGLVPDENFRKQLENEVRQATPTVAIVNELKADSSDVDPWWASQAFPAVGSFLQGTQGDASISFLAESMSASGTVRDEETRRLLTTTLKERIPDGVTTSAAFTVAEAVPSTPSSLRVAVSAQKLQVAGRVTDTATKESILASIRSAQPNVTIDDQLDIDPTATVPVWSSGIGGMLGSYLPAIQSGGLIIDESALELSGEVKSDALRIGLGQAAAKLIGSENSVFNRLTVAATEVQQEAATVEVFKENAIYFASGSTEISQEDQQKLRTVAEAAKRQTGRLLFVGGYADMSGNPADNKRLSLARATVVKQKLIALGVPEGMLEVESFGAERVAGEEAWKSRRVQLTFKN